jgi:hypothetical protein
VGDPWGKLEFHSSVMADEQAAIGFVVCDCDSHRTEVVDCEGKIMIGRRDTRDASIRAQASPDSGAPVVPLDYHG